MIRRLATDAFQETTDRRAMRPVEPPALAPNEANDAAAFGDGYRDGYEAGEADARDEATRRLNQLEAELRERHEALEARLAAERSRLATLFEGLEAAETRRMRELEDTAFEVALQSLAHAFGTREGDQNMLRRMVTQTLGQISADSVCLRVAASDRDLLPEAFAGVSVQVQRDLPSGTCLFVTELGTIETSLAMRLTAITNAMLAAFEGGER